MNIYKRLYSKNTKSIRVLNLILGIVWSSLVVAEGHSLPVIIPQGIAHLSGTIFLLSILTIILTVHSFYAERYTGYFRCISLHVGSLLQAMIGMGYLGEYPPLDAAAILSFLMAFWLIGAAYYTMNEEDLKEKRKENCHARSYNYSDDNRTD